jgi:hypothetical protein
MCLLSRWLYASQCFQTLILSETTQKGLSVKAEREEGAKAFIIKYGIDGLYHALAICGNKHWSSSSGS